MVALFRMAARLARLSAARAARRVGMAFAVLMLAMFFLMIGITGFSAALWIAIARVLDPVSAALIIGGAGFVLAAVLMLIAIGTLKSQRPVVPVEVKTLLGEFRASSGSQGVLGQLIGAGLLAFFLASRGKK